MMRSLFLAAVAALALATTGYAQCPGGVCSTSTGTVYRSYPSYASYGYGVYYHQSPQYGAVRAYPASTGTVYQATPSYGAVRVYPTSYGTSGFFGGGCANGRCR
jgi:hypothetical protein